MSRSEKHLFHKLVKKFGAKKANKLYNDFTDSIKEKYVKEFIRGNAEDFIINTQPKLFKDYVTTKLQ